jgi:hypothetical protein
VLHDDAPRPAMLMALRLACNLAALEEGARSLVGSEEDAAVATEAIAKGLSYPHPGVQNAAAGMYADSSHQHASVTSAWRHQSNPIQSNPIQSPPSSTQRSRST